MKKIPLVRVAYDGWKFIVFFAFLGFLFLFFGLWFAKLAGAVCVLLALFSLNFFRDPERDSPKTEDLVSPADGTVLEVLSIGGEGFGAGKVIRIFLSVFDVHIQRSPAAGTVRSVHYLPGVFLDARDPRAPFANESNAVEIETARGRVVVKQIAGLIARRIVCWVRPDDAVQAGERIGLIRFGSQVDLYIPSEVEVSVKEGDRVVGGETVVARWPRTAGELALQNLEQANGQETTTGTDVAAQS